MTTSDEPQRTRIMDRVRQRPALWGGLAAAAVVGLLVVLLWFQPQALLFDQVVEDEFPGPAAAPAATEAATEQPTADAATPEPAVAPTATSEVTEVEATPPEPEVVALRSGTFASRNRYSVTGTATVYDIDGSRVLRLEGFESTNGPDLFVYLTSADAADGDADLGADFVDLGVLKGNVGNQNYDIPVDVELDRYDTAVIWCRRFSTGFGAADLAPAE
jgi:hypothetical protein